jgi:type II secretory pathway pseudopilin PulG
MVILEESAMKTHHSQGGAALIIFVIGLVLVATGVFYYQLNAVSSKFDGNQKTALALAEAKAALIGYAITYDDNHSGELYGYLPCPDINPTDPSGEGAESVCGSLNVSVLGRFPWKTLETEPLKDGNGECLWYAVSGSFKNNPKTAGISPNTLGQLEVLSTNGTYLASPADPAVAVIFSSGAPLPGQSRVANANAKECGGNYIASNYLDSDIVTSKNNAIISNSPNTNSTFVMAPDSQNTANDQDQFNDKLIIITRSDIFSSYCKKYANTLLSYLSPTINGCDNGGVPNVSCQKASDNLQNCASPCKSAAQTFISYECLTDITAVNCQTAIGDLEGCHA